MHTATAGRGGGFRSLLGALALILALPLIGLAQSDNATISGYVKDATGAVLPNVKVIVRNEDRAFERSATTNNEGYFTITSLPPGVYTVIAEGSGFKRYEERGKKIDPNIAANIDVSLQPGDLSETVSVVASTTGVQTETATVGQLVEGKQIQYLQLNGRNPLFLSLLKPGVSGGALGQFSFGLTTGGLNINGARTQDNLITFDGAVGVRTRSNGTSIGVADIEATQEVQILTANYNAEYGRAAGGQIRIVTKSGSNDFHGTFYEFLRNSAFNANEWSRNRNTPANSPCSDERYEKLAHCRPNPFRYNQYGYSLSGPIPKTGGKLFWLWGQEWVKQRRTDNTTQRVPTERMRNGDFSELFPGGPNYIPQLGVTRFVRDPLKTGACNATDQSACFSDGGIINKIPANRLSRNGLALLRALPVPVPGFYTSSGQNFFQERPTTTDQRKNTLSVDFYPNERHQLKYRLQMFQFIDKSAFRGGTDRAPQIIDRPNQTTSLNWTWTISPTWISETLVAASRDQVFIYVDTEGDRYKRSNYGIDYQYIFPDRKEITDKIPTVDGLDIFTSLDGGPYPAQSTGPIYQVSNNWTNIRGNHTLKFGGYFERAGQNDFDQINVAGTPGGTNNQNGRFVFSNATTGGTGVAAANAAIGLFETYAEIGQRSFTPYRGHMFEWFAQDSWKATPQLRIEYGLRHTIIQPYYSLWRNMTVFDERYYDPRIAVVQDPRTGFIISGDLRSQYNGVLIPGDGFPPSAAGRVNIVNDPNFAFLFRGEPKEYSEIHWKDTFQPRIGIAYAFNDKTVLRAGGGRFLTRLGVSDSVFLGGNPPLQPTVSLSLGSVDNPGGRGANAFPLQITTQDRIFKNPESWAWSATFQREIGFDTTLEVGYVGRRGLHGQRERNINQLATGTRFLPQNAGVNPDFLRPYKGFSIIRRTNNDANSLYNSLQVSANRRFTNGFLFGVAYTYSKAEDDGSAQRFVVPDAYDTSFLWGPADYDRRHVMVINVIWDLPIFRDRSSWTGKLLGGWTISAVSQFQTGTPFSIAREEDYAGVGPGSGPQLWVVNGDPELSRGDREFASNNNDNAYWFRVVNPNGTPIFTRPANGTWFKERVRNFLYNPGFQNHNLGLFKEFGITERHRLQFRAEAFNWLNHPNWNGPNTNPNDFNPNNPVGNTFGKVTTKSSERQLQFALRYSF